MKKFLFLIFIFLLISCANTAETVTEENLDGDYRVTGVKGDQILPDDIVFNFDSLGNTVSGNTGCNNFSAHYNQQGRNLEFSTPMNTRKYCEGKMDVEMQILSSLERASRLHRTGKEIVIFSSNDQPLMTLTKIDRRE